METTQYYMKKNPHDSTNPVMKLLFLWTIELFKVGSKDDLKIEDLFLPKAKDKSTSIGLELERHWNAEVKRCQKKICEEDTDQKRQPKPSLFRALLCTFKWEFVFLGILGFFNEVISRLSQPILLGIILSYFRPIPSIPIEYALYAAAALVLLNLITAVSVNHYMFASYRLGMRARVAVCSLIYRKSLKLSATALGDSTPGKVVNLLSNDVNRFDLSAFFIHFLWLAPFAALITLVLLFQEVGIAGVLGIVVVFTVMPLQSYTGKLSARFRLQTAIRTDERVRLMNEIISGVQVIKMYTWEIPFTKLVQLARKLELRVVRKNSYVRALFMSFMLFTTRAAIFCTMTSLVLQGKPLTATKVFVFAQFFATLSMTMSAMFVRSISESAEAWVSIHRLQDFLNQEEFQGHHQMQKIKCSITGQDGKHVNEITEEVSMEPKKSRTSIRITKGNAKWCESEEMLTLQDINIEILKGKLVGIIGPVGSGKSSLLQAILGELNLESGSIDVNGRVSYASQEPWVFGSTVRQNILFGLPYDEFRYNEVVRVCSLQKDFQQFSNGDQTLVGDKGTSLSGGQKARINLARAVYREADIYLLDDPLSAVDAHVGRQLYNKCVRTYLRKKTRLLVTHQLHHLTDADHIIIMRNGKIEMQGSYHSIATSSLEYARLLIPSEIEKQTDFERPEYEREISRERSIKQRRNRSRLNSLSSVNSLRSMSMSSSYADLGDLNLEEPDKFLEEKPVVSNAEVSSKGAVEGSVGMHYIKAATNWFGIVLAVLLFTGTQALASFFDYFVAFWTSQEERRYHHNLNNYTSTGDSVTVFPLLNTNVTTEFTIRDYANTITLQGNDTLSVDQFVYPRNVLMAVGGVTVILILLVGLLRAFHFYHSCIRASQTLHDLMFRGIIRSPMKFFDVTPIGRIMNRFSKDMGAVDELLPKAFLDAAQQLLVMAGAVAVASTVNPLFLAVVAVLAFVFYFLRKAYLKSSKNIKRFEGITRSPVFSHLGATLAGLPTIRASQAQTVIQDEFDKLQDVHTSSFFMYISTMGAFGFSLDCLCLLFVTAVTFSFFVLDSDVLGDKVGLAITQAISLTFLMQYGVRQSAEVANQLMAVERLVEYTQLPPEQGIRPDDIDVRQARKTNSKLASFRTPPRGWPDRGRVEFRALSLRYGPGDDPDGWVLNNLSFVIQPREKVGIVGRTGAGKSSLIQAMFRLAHLKGDIIIDDVNAGDVTLEDLRKHLSIIPQDPMLFNGTLRRNLDPFEEFSDDALWTVLTEVELKESLSNPAGLAMHVLDGGANLSVGQRQLICLARALLRNNRLLMMDEATANVDPYTDNLIQQTIRTKFTDCTVLTIAHRLNTIMDSDKVLVMELGNLVEFDHPYLLLQKKGAIPEEDGYFRKMVLETGADTFSKLEQIAKECYMKKQQDLPL